MQTNKNNVIIDSSMDYIKTICDNKQIIRSIQKDQAKQLHLLQVMCKQWRLNPDRDPHVEMLGKQLVLHLEMELGCFERVTYDPEIIDACENSDPTWQIRFNPSYSEEATVIITATE